MALLIARGRGVSGGGDNNALSLLPRIFALQQNYPNPFNAVTTIPFTLERALPVRVVVYNQLGQRVETLFEGELNRGEHLIRWEAGGMASGIYIYRIEAEALNGKG